MSDYEKGPSSMKYIENGFKCCIIIKIFMHLPNSEYSEENVIDLTVLGYCEIVTGLTYRNNVYKWGTYISK